MKSNQRVMQKDTAILLLQIIVLLFLFGCSVVGTNIPESERIAFAGSQESTGTFKQGLLTIDYSYRLSGSKLSIAGNVGYLGGVDYLDVRVVFLDQQGVVLEQKIVYAIEYRKARGYSEVRNFEKILEMPVNSAGFSFVYSSQDRRSYR
ncbi:MAG: hypothetical protein V2I36_13015 [Desulfopila sp.]|jgi:hypothetical protein|nr:hypothetical protein [Desulfopila sp.]